MCKRLHWQLLINNKVGMPQKELFNNFAITITKNRNGRAYNFDDEGHCP